MLIISLVNRNVDLLYQVEMIIQHQVLTLLDVRFKENDVWNLWVVVKAGNAHYALN